MDRQRSEILKTWVLVLQLGLIVITAEGLCIVIALVVKNVWQTDIMLLMVLLGLVSGTAAAFRLAYTHAGADDEKTKLTTGIYDRAADAKRREHVPEEDSETDELMEEYEALCKDRDEPL